MINLIVLDDPGLVLTGKSTGSWVRVCTGVGMGTTKDTQGLLVPFTKCRDCHKCRSPMSSHGFTCGNTHGFSTLIS